MLVVDVTCYIVYIIIYYIHTPTHILFYIIYYYIILYIHILIYIILFLSSPVQYPSPIFLPDPLVLFCSSILQLFCSLPSIFQGQSLSHPPYSLILSHLHPSSIPLVFPIPLQSSPLLMFIIPSPVLLFLCPFDVVLGSGFDGDKDLGSC